MAFSDRLSALDASFLDIEDPGTHMHVGAVLVLDALPLRDAEGRLAYDRIAAMVEARIHDFPRYRQRIARIPVENHPAWVDDPDWNLQYHLRHTSLPKPGDLRQLKRLAGLMSSVDRIRQSDLTSIADRVDGPWPSRPRDLRVDFQDESLRVRRCELSASSKSGDGTSANVKHADLADALANWMESFQGATDVRVDSLQCDRHACCGKVDHAIDR